MSHDKKKKYQQGGVVGTAEYSQRSFQTGGVVGTPEYSKRTGYKHGGISKKKKNAYEDGGIVKDYFKKGQSEEKSSGSKNSVAARINALEDLRDQMSSMGGESLSKSMKSPKEDAYEDEGHMESSDDYASEEKSEFDELSKEQLIALLKNK